MKHRYAKITCLILISFLALLWSGCGESGNPGGDTGPGATASIALNAGLDSMPADGVTSTTVTATLRDSSNEPVYERTAVVFRTSRGTFRNGSQEYKVKIPDDSGSISVTLIADSSPGTAEIWAEANNISQKIEVRFFDPGKVGAISLRTGAASITADGESRVAVIATVEDNLGNREEGATVTFKTSLGEFVEDNPLPGIINRTTEADTDVDGEAAVMLVSGRTIGTATILASINGMNATATVTFTADVPKTITLRAAPSVVKPEGTSTLFARLVDANGNPVANQNIVFSQVTNASEGALNILTASTNVNGEAQATYTAGDDEGTDILQAALASNLDMKAQTAVTVDPGAIVIAGIDVTTGAASLVADGNSQVNIRAIVTDVDGRRPKGKTVTFTTTAGTLSSATGTTDENGMVNIMLRSSTIAGPVTVRADCDGFIDEAVVQFVPGPAHHIIMYAFPNVVPPNGPFQTAAIVQDEYDNRIDDQRLMLQVRRAGHPEIVDTAEMTPDQAEDGVYRFDWTAARAYGEGNLEITARVNNGVSETVTVVVDETATIVGAINVIAGAEEIKADGTSSVLIRATVLDYNGAPAQGITVKFDTTLGTLSSAEKKTDANGIADVMLTAGEIWGTATVSADANGFWDEVDVRFSSLKAGGVSLTTMPRVVKPGGQATVIAELRDSKGDPVPNQVLYFDIYENNTNGTLSAIQGITDTNGRVTLTYTAGVILDYLCGICACSGDRIRVTLASDSSITDDTCVTVSTGDVGYLTLTSDLNTLPADSISSTAVTATAFDTSGVPMPQGTRITLTTTLGTFPNGTQQITIQTIDNSGAVITSLIAGDTGGVAQITASCSGVSQLLYIIINDGAVSVGSILLSANPTSLPNDGASSTAITAVVRDTGGNPVPFGTPVAFSIDPALGCTFPNGAASIVVNTPDASGTVTTSLMAGLQDGVLLLKATAGSLTQAIEIPILEEVTGGLALTADPTSMVADGTSTSLIRATLTDNEGAPIAGATVDFATTLGTLSAASATTNASGIADVVLTSETTTGTATVTAQANGITATVDVTFTSGAPINIDLSASIQLLNPGETSQLTATVTDGNGNPLSGETIAFVVSPNQSGATVSPSSVTTINGQATAVYTAGPNSGDDVITARSITDSNITDNVTIVVGGQVSLVASPTSIVADGISTSTFTATVLNNVGDPMEGVPVIFKNVPPGTYFSQVLSGTGPGDTSVFRHYGGTMTLTMSHTGSANFVVWLVDKNTNNRRLVKNVIGSLTNQQSQLQVDEGDYYFEISLADGSWQIQVEGQTTQTEFDNLPTLAVIPTDASGQAAYVYTSTTAVNNVRIGIKVGNVLADATIQQIAGAPATLQVSASPNPMHPGADTTVTAKITDANNNPVSGLTVTFAPTIINSGGSLGATSAVTDLSGEAKVTYTAGYINLTTDRITATSGALPSDFVDIVVDASAIVVGTISLSANPTSIPADGSSSTAITVTLRDTNGDPMPAGTPVILTTTRGTFPGGTDPDGIGPLTSRVTLTTSGTGGVIITSLIAGATPGTATVVAASDSVSQAIQVVLRDVDVPEAASLSLSTSKTSIKTNGADSATITALVLDGNNAPIEGATVSFQSSGGMISAASAETDENGQATITLRSGPDKANGTVTVTASVDALTADVPIVMFGTVLSIIPSSAQLEFNNKREIVILAVDADSNPIYDAAITISYNYGGTGSSFTEDGSPVPTGSILNTNYEGEIILELTAGAMTSGTVTLNASGLDTTATGTYVIGDPDDIFQITAPTSPDDVVPIPGCVGVTLHAGELGIGDVVVFTTSVGTWQETGTQTLEHTITAGDLDGGGGFYAVTRTLCSNQAGLATVQVYDKNDVSTSDAVQISFYTPADQAYDIIINASQTNVAPSTATTKNSVVIEASVIDINLNPVQGATVQFSLSNTTGGGEYISPVSAVTDSSGIARTTFTSGTLSTGSDPASAVEVTARVDTPAACTNEIVDITCAGGAVGGTYFSIYQTGVNYYVWYDENNTSTDPGPTTPALAGFTGIEVDVVAGPTANGVAIETRNALNAAGFTATNNTLPTIQVATCGDVTDAGTLFTVGFTFNTVTQGTGVAWKEDSVAITITGAVANVSIGWATEISPNVDNTLYLQPVSVLVADTNGNPVSGAVVSLGLKPSRFRTGYWFEDLFLGWIIVLENPCSGAPATPFVFINEDLNNNAILDGDEDKTNAYTAGAPGLPGYFDGYVVSDYVPGLNDGKLTPGQAVAGTIPPTVTTDENGVASFTLTYQKEYAIWVEDQITATVDVFGTEYITSSRRWLPYSSDEEEVIRNAFPESPFNVLPCKQATAWP